MNLHYYCTIIVKAVQDPMPPMRANGKTVNMLLCAFAGEGISPASSGITRMGDDTWPSLPLFPYAHKIAINISGVSLGSEGS